MAYYVEMLIGLSLAVIVQKTCFRWSETPNQRSDQRHPFSNLVGRHASELFHLV